jgi:hypothetical protein
MIRATIIAKAMPAVAFATNRPPAIVIRTITMRNNMVFGSIAVVSLFILMESDCLVLDVVISLCHFGCSEKSFLLLTPFIKGGEKE